MPPTLQAAARNYRLSALIARRAVREAQKVRNRGLASVAAVVAAHQVANATTSRTAVADMLDEQDIASAADAILNVLAFTTDAPTLDAMLAEADQAAFDRIVESIVQDAARAAESVAVAVRPNIAHVRYVNLPCCARCAVLAGRVYRWSDGFQRHPGCDCSMIPTTVASPLRQDPDELVRAGQVRGLSRSDLQALNDGADISRVVNVRLRSAGLLEAGHAMRRGNRLTPAAIYRVAGDDRPAALALFESNGYIL